MNQRHTSLVQLAILLTGAMKVQAQKSAGSNTASDSAATQQRQYLIESYRRQDWTGRGTFHRIGMFETQQNSYSLAADAPNSQDVGTVDKQSDAITISDIFSLQINGKSMLFGSDNIFNTEINTERDGQFAQFVGMQLNAQFNEHWKLASTFDQAWFLHTKSEHASSDFVTSTAKQTLSYDQFIFNNKASISLPFSWQYSDLYNRQTGDRTLSTSQYGAGLELSWFPTTWMIPNFSYAYSYQDASGPGDPADKHKHDFNLGVTFIPFKDKQFYLIPSLQYSHEEFSTGRRDDAWTPTMTVSYQPLTWLAFDLVGSYTDSRSSAAASSFDALTGTAFVRIFYTW